MDPIEKQFKELNKTLNSIKDFIIAQVQLTKLQLQETNKLRMEVIKLQQLEE